jgi:hypothetical protein
VLARRACRGGLVAGAHGLEDPRVRRPAGDHGLAPAGTVAVGDEEEVHLRADVQPARLEPAVAGRPVDRVVERQVEAGGVLPGDGTAEGRAELVERGGGGGEVGRLGPARRELGCDGLQPHAQAVELLQVGLGELDDAGAAVPGDPHQALAFEQGEGLADGTAADLQAAGEVLLAQVLARCELAVEDREAHLVGDVLGEAAPARRCERRPHRPLLHA